MTDPICRMRGPWFLAALALSLFLPGQGKAQQTPGKAPQPAKVAAPIDLTGYWVTIITQDWRWRMVTPAKGDYAGVPITAEAKRVADTWDPAKDQATGAACKSYGAPELMHSPTRLHITWRDDNTLRVDTDYGMQTRLLHFGGWKGSGASSLQGDSAAVWEIPKSAGLDFGRPPEDGEVRAAPIRYGDMKVITDHLTAGYLRKNGVPYSANAVVTEYWDLFKEPNGDQRIMLAMRVNDPVYLTTPWVTVLQFKKEADNSKWDPSPCDPKW
jgi:hypothetical protein